MTMRRLASVGSVFLFMMAGAVGAASQESSDRATTAMSEFLDAWLVKRDRDGALSHISGSIRSQDVAPRSVWLARNGEPRLSEEQREAYWGILNKLGHSPEPRDSLQAALVPRDRDLVDLLHQQAHVVQPGPFIVLVADTELAIDSFDAGYGDVATALQPDKNVILTMIADYTGRRREDTGPFVSFWMEEPDGWRIQALGGVPQEAAWLDDGR